jgi:uncharacterized membrane protein YesL
MKFLNSNFYHSLVKISNFLLLNVLWFLLALPLITLFPATVAMMAVVRDWRSKEESGVFKPFFHHFKDNFKQSFLYGILWAIILIILYINFILLGEMGSMANTIVTILLIILGVLVTFVSIYLFPVMVYFQFSFWENIKKSLLFSVIHFPTTLLCVLLLLLMITLLLYLPFTVVFVFSTTAYFIFQLCEKTFK